MLSKERQAKVKKLDAILSKISGSTTPVRQISNEDQEEQNEMYEMIPEDQIKIEVIDDEDEYMPPTRLMPRTGLESFQSNTCDLAGFHNPVLVLNNGSEFPYDWGNLPMEVEMFNEGLPVYDDESYPHDRVDMSVDSLICDPLNVVSHTSVEARRTALDAYLYQEHNNHHNDHDDLESAIPFHYGIRSKDTFVVVHPSESVGIVCNICKRSFSTKKALKRHCKDVHKTNPEAKTTGKSKQISAESEHTAVLGNLTGSSWPAYTKLNTTALQSSKSTLVSKGAKQKKSSSTKTTAPKNASQLKTNEKGKSLRTDTGRTVTSKKANVNSSKGSKINKEGKMNKETGKSSKLRKNGKKVIACKDISNQSNLTKVGKKSLNITASLSQKKSGRGTNAVENQAKLKKGEEKVKIGKPKEGENARKKEPALNHKELVTSLKKEIEDLPFKCEECGDGFRTFVNLKKHLPFHSVVKYHCYRCDDVFMNMRALTKHLLIHEDEAPVIDHLHRCRICSQGFKTSRMLRGHMLEHERMEALDSTIVKNKAKSQQEKSNRPKTGQLKDNLRVDMSHSFIDPSTVSHSSGDELVEKQVLKGAKYKRNHNRQIVDSQQSRKAGLSENIIVSTDMVTDDSQTSNLSPTDSDRSLYCTFCQIAFQNYVELKDHVIKSHINYGDMSLQCEKCNEVFTSETEVVKHLIDYHKMTPREARAVLRQKEREAIFCGSHLKASTSVQETSCDAATVVNGNDNCKGSDSMPLIVGDIAMQEDSQTEAGIDLGQEINARDGAKNGIHDGRQEESKNMKADDVHYNVDILGEREDETKDLLNEKSSCFLQEQESRDILQALFIDVEDDVPSQDDELNASDKNARKSNTLSGNSNVLLTDDKASVRSNGETKWMLQRGIKGQGREAKAKGSNCFGEFTDLFCQTDKNMISSETLQLSQNGGLRSKQQKCLWPKCNAIKEESKDPRTVELFGSKNEECRVACSALQSNNCRQVQVSVTNFVNSDAHVDDLTTERQNLCADVSFVDKNVFAPYVRRQASISGERRILESLSAGKGKRRSNVLQKQSVDCRNDTISRHPEWVGNETDRTVGLTEEGKKQTDRINTTRLSNSNRAKQTHCSNSIACSVEKKKGNQSAKRKRKLWRYGKVGKRVKRKRTLSDIHTAVPAMKDDSVSNEAPAAPPHAGSYEGSDTPTGLESNVESDAESLIANGTGLLPTSVENLPRYLDMNSWNRKRKSRFTQHEEKNSKKSNGVMISEVNDGQLLGDGMCDCCLSVHCTNTHTPTVRRNADFSRQADDTKQSNIDSETEKNCELSSNTLPETTIIPHEFHPKIPGLTKQGLHNSDNNSKKLQCGFCNKRFHTMYFLRLHEKRHSEMQTDRHRKTVVFRCQFCAAMLSSKKSLAQHLRVHNEERHSQKVAGSGKLRNRRRGLQGHKGK